MMQKTRISVANSVRMGGKQFRYQTDLTARDLLPDFFAYRLYGLAQCLSDFSYWSFVAD